MSFLLRSIIQAIGGGSAWSGWSGGSYHIKVTEQFANYQWQMKEVFSSAR